MSVHHLTKALQDCDSQSIWHYMPDQFLLMLRKNCLNEMAKQLPTPDPLTGGPGFLPFPLPYRHD